MVEVRLMTMSILVRFAAALRVSRLATSAAGAEKTLVKVLAKAKMEKSEILMVKDWCRLDERSEVLVVY